MIARCDYCGKSAECQLIPPDANLACSECEAGINAANERIWALADDADEAAKQGNPLTVNVEVMEQ